MKIISKLVIWILLFILSSSSSLYSQQDAISDLEYQTCARKIKSKYDAKAYQLKPSKAAHMGMRLWRNYDDSKYKFLLLQGINYASNSLDKLVENGLDSFSLESYVHKKNLSYKGTTEKKRLRKRTLERFPSYRLICTQILRHVARLNELGLSHEHNEDFIRLIENYDFKTVFEDGEMIRAWGAQLANQVVWLHDLGIYDYRNLFRKAVKLTYPKDRDSLLSKQQFENKIYTLTHIIIGASGYYRYNVDYNQFADIVDYFRNNIDYIIKTCKEDVVIEVGLSLLLVNEEYPEINLIKTHIYNKVDKKDRMVLSTTGKSNFAQGEHRNIIAILLLDWKGCNNSPSSKDMKQLKSYLDESLVWNLSML